MKLRFVECRGKAGEFPFSVEWSSVAEATQWLRDHVLGFLRHGPVSTHASGFPVSEPLIFTFDHHSESLMLG